MDVTMWHNPRCSKSRQTLQLLKDRGIEPDLRLYLENPPSVEEIEHTLELLAMEPRDLMRQKEDEYKANGLDDESLDRRALIAAMNRNPRLIERPVVISGGKAALGRPPENVLDIL